MDQNENMDKIMSEIDFDDRLRFHEFVKAGQVIPQGDIYLHVVPDFSQESIAALATRLNTAWKLPNLRLAGPGTKADLRQVVPGNTDGARHCVSADSANVVEMFLPATGANPLQGNLIRASARWTLDHPEHGAHSIPEGHYVVIRQRDFAQEQLAAIAD